MHLVNIYEAKTHFSKLIEAVIQGEEVIIAKAGKPVAKIERFQSKPKRRFGVLKGKIKIAEDFDEPLPENIIADFER
jgi:antitoxin (DNA-binding transcriptional repressor) of toxin-antitoxin stability system